MFVTTSKKPNTLNKMDLKAAFAGGFTTVVGYASITLKINFAALATETIIKLVMTIIIGFIGGIAGMLAKDFYRNYFKKYIWKK